MKRKFESGEKSWKRKRTTSENSVQQIKDLEKSRSNIMDYNSLLSNFASHKQLDMALLTYESLQRKKLKPTIFTYSPLINAFVRCGEIEKSHEMHHEMIKRGIQPNEITFTTLIKGYAQNNKVKEAIKILDVMKNEYKIVPNIRTYNSILRGCLNWGNRKTAEKIYKEMIEKKIYPDETSYQYLIQCLCQSNKMDKVWELKKEMEEYHLAESSSYIAIARQCALDGDWKKSSELLENAKKVLEIEKKNARSGQSSLPLFLKFKAEEIELEYKNIKKYIEKKKKSTYSTFLECERVILNPEKKLKFKKIFGNDNPIYLEICSGSGDWVNEKASKDPNINWISLEMRFDRNYQIFSKMCFKNIDNLLILGGEALDYLENYFKKKSIDKIFINYPDPPVWEESKQTLINEKFLKKTHRVLKTDGEVILVTDNYSYCSIMVKEFKPMVEDGKFESHYKELFAEELPSGYGSSYFDRFWVNGEKTKRFYLQFKKH